MSRTPRHFKAVLFSRAATAAGFSVPCKWCGVPLSYQAATVDHEPPLAEGGTPRGAVLACDGCNQARSRETTARANAKRKKGKCHKRRKKR